MDTMEMKPGIVASKHIKAAGGKTTFITLFEDEHTGTYILQATNFEIENGSNPRLENVTFPKMEAHSSFEEAKRAFDDLVYEMTSR